MGYRSDGAWIITGTVENIRAAWAALKLTHPLPPGESEDLWSTFELYQVNGVGYIHFEFEGWKWYDSYSAIQWYESIWDELCNEQWKLNGHRVRLGEDDDDTDTASFHNTAEVDYALISVSRSYNIDAPTSGEPITN